MQQNDPGIMWERIIQGRTKCKSKDPEAEMFWTAIMDERKRSKKRDERQQGGQSIFSC